MSLRKADFTKNIKNPYISKLRNVSDSGNQTSTTGLAFANPRPSNIQNQLDHKLALTSIEAQIEHTAFFIFLSSFVTR
jgi:hypothetical protein